MLPSPIVKNVLDAVEIDLTRLMSRTRDRARPFDTRVFPFTYGNEEGTGKTYRDFTERTYRSRRGLLVAVLVFLRARTTTL